MYLDDPPPEDREPPLPQPPPSAGGASFGIGVIVTCVVLGLLILWKAPRLYLVAAVLAVIVVVLVVGNWLFKPTRTYDEFGTPYDAHQDPRPGLLMSIVGGILSLLFGKNDDS